MMCRVASALSDFMWGGHPCLFSFPPVAMSHLTGSSYTSAIAELLWVIDQWSLVPLRTVEVGDYAMWFLSAQVCLLLFLLFAV
jgi:hypothetical protein